MKTVIAPSLLSADFARLAEEVRRAEDAGADWHHVDVMDGHFVPNLTIGPPVVKALSRVARRPLDVHLMITDPWRYAGDFLEAGAASLTFHAELLQEAAQRERGRELLRAIKSRGKRAALAVNPETPLAPALPLLGEVDMVLVMSVRPGFGGQAFMPEVLDKVRALRGTHGYRGDVEMDGGLARDTVSLCAAAGCNVFVAGSALYRAADMRAEIAAFRQLIAASAAVG